MEAHRHFGKAGSAGRKQGAASRRTSLLVALISALLAAGLIYLFVTHFKKAAAPAAPQETTVWVAKRYIPQGTPQSAIAAYGLLKPVQVPVGQAQVGAITDPSEITSEVASAPIAAGEQIKASEFTRPTASFSTVLAGNQRAVAFSMDAEHGLTTYLQPGNTVDIMGQAGGSTTLLAQNVTILDNSGGLVILRLTDRQALLITAATGTSSLWLSLRPSINAKNSIRVGSVGR